MPDYSDVFRPLEKAEEEKNNSSSFFADTEKNKIFLAKKESKASLRAAKIELLRACSVSMVGNPRLENSSDPTRLQILSLAEQVAQRGDGEFVLKVR